MASSAGLAPKIIQLITRIIKLLLSKLGHKRLRKLLYMFALLAITDSPILMAAYEQWKTKKVALVVVTRKQLILSYDFLNQ
ncbi:MAG: hypothetical protein HOE45_05540 [Gammaproteobacteria bacterium]|nr:hypothetical protein [Gammaproteobacteria bacterium]MBT4146333.1 hypothetical protein [Gammaproteobacteria bacterium]MBT5221761.1 hypothetical protein [Gammaproteobacteria bacterium]MBT5826463.1 hypothetical protein [Gammaproteobacteria bacterium]MBT5967632.1 hypothetical protein [Gammaproteobacteria bacterium]